MKRVALYIRVSTSNQDTENERRELEAVADRSDRKIVKIYEDAGVSGANGRDQRPALDAMKSVNAKEIRHGRDLVSGSARPLTHRPAGHTPGST